MTARFFLLWSAQRVPRIACVGEGGELLWEEVTCTADASPEEQAEAIAVWLREKHGRVDELACLVESDSCYSVTLSATDIVERDRSTLRYRLEEFVPIPVEALAVDFVFSNQGIFACAVELEPLGKLLAALTHRGIRISSVGPRWIRAVEGWISRSETSVDAAVWQDEERVEVIWLEDQAPVGWRSGGSDLRSWSAVLSATVRNGRVLLAGLSEEDLAELCRTRETTWFSSEASPDTWIPDACARLERGDAAGSIDWRDALLGGATAWRGRDRLVREVLVATAIALLLVGCGAWVRGFRYEEARTATEADKERLFRELFPGEPVPRGIERRFALELAQIEESADGAVNGVRRSALNTLRDILESLPSELRFQLDRVDVEGRRFKIQGKVREVGMAGRIAAELRKLGYQTTVPNDGRNFVVIGVLPASGDSPSGKEKAR